VRTFNLFNQLIISQIAVYYLILTPINTPLL
jgi:hypothetical protein